MELKETVVWNNNIIIIDNSACLFDFHSIVNGKNVFPIIYFS